MAAKKFFSVSLWRKVRCFVLVCGWSFGVCAVVTAIMPPGNARRLALPIYENSSKQPTAILRVENISRESRRMGFFQVKLLPTFVADGVRIELQPGFVSSNCLEKVSSALKSIAGKAKIEIRNLEVILPGETAPSLEIKSLRPSAQPVAMLLLEEIKIRDRDVSVNLPCAKINLNSGDGIFLPQADRLSPVLCSLLHLSKTNTAPIQQ